MVRKSPKESATLFPLGKVCVGLDGNKWIVAQTKNGVKRWKMHKKGSFKRRKCDPPFGKPPKDCRKACSKKRKRSRKRSQKSSRKRSQKRKRSRKRSRKRRSKKSTMKRRPSQKKTVELTPLKDLPKFTQALPKGTSYLMHDNGGRPYMVVKKSPRITEIYKKSKKYYDLNYDDQYRVWSSVKNIKKLFTDLVKRYTNVQKFFAGRDYSGYGFHGNSVLLRLPNKRYVFIGHEIYEFTAPEDITNYYSNVGNSDVPYPVALSKNYAYFMADQVYIPKDEFPKDQDWSDAYGAFYGHTTDGKQMKGKKFKNRKVIKKRDISL